MAENCARLLIKYNGAVDLSQDVSPDLISFTYTDNAAGVKDDVRLSLRDTARKWGGDWLPVKGDALECSIEFCGRRLDCGSFVIDTITASAPPHVVAISASSAPRRTSKTGSKGSAPTGGAINEPRFRNFERSNLYDLARKIADEAGLTLKYLPESRPEFAHSTQDNETGYAFIRRLAEARGFGVKTTPDALIIMEHKKIDAAEPAQIVDICENDVASWSMTTEAAQAVSAVIVSFYDPKTRKTYKFEQKDDDIEGGTTLRLNANAGSVDEARKIAAAKLRARNAKSAGGNLTFAGRVDLVAGIVLNLIGFGAFDGHYKVVRATHTLGGGYVTGVDVEKVITKY